MYDLDDFNRAAAEELAEYQRHAEDFERLRAENLQRRETLATRLQEAQQRLGQAALPELTEAGFGELARRMGTPQIFDLYRRMVAQSEQLTRRVAEIDNDPVYQNRDLRRLQISERLKEERPLYEHARNGLQQLEAMPGLAALLARRYGTQHYPYRSLLRFFNRTFLNDWKNADAIVEALGVNNFREVPPLYAERQDQVNALGGSVKKLMDELDHLTALEDERAQKLAADDALPQTTQAAAGEVVARYLAARGKDATQVLPLPDAALSEFVAIDGIDHQLRYLDEVQNRVIQDYNQLLERRDKLQQEHQRYVGNSYKYRNKRFTQDQFGKRFGRASRYSKTYTRYARTSETVYVFDRYDSYSPWDDYLWWDVITDGRIDGNFISEVSDWRDQHPDYSYARTPIQSNASDSDWRDDS